MTKEVAWSQLEIGSLQVGIDLENRTHVLGTIHTNQATFETMRKTGGAIADIASLAGVVGAPGLASYSASKGAMLGWTRSIAAEWGRYDIRVSRAPRMPSPTGARRRAQDAGRARRS